MLTNFQEILKDYDGLVNTSVYIPLDDGQCINFKFRKGDFPHLIGLHKLKDLEVIRKFVNPDDKSVTAGALCRDIEVGILTESSFQGSKEYSQIKKSRIEFFTSQNIIRLIKSKHIVCFNPSLIKEFNTKLEKVDYLFWTFVEQKDNNYGQFGIGFTVDKNNNFPNTFFYRNDDLYIRNQKKVNPLSVRMKDKTGKIYFDIYWENVRTSLKSTNHYKYVKSIVEKLGIDIMELTMSNVENLEIDDTKKKEFKRHFLLLRIDEVKKVYTAYLDEANHVLKPNEVKRLVDHYRNMQK